MKCDPALLTLYLVTDRGMLRGLEFADFLRRAVEGGVTCVQLREKSAGGAEFYRLAMESARVLEPLRVPLIVNARVDIAAAVPCLGVHLGQHDLPLEAARRILGPDRVIGISVNNVAEAIAAEQAGADYLGVSPVYRTGTKTDTDPAVGPAGLGRIAAAVRIPVVGIGGINAANAALMRPAGAAGICVVSAICAAADPAAAARALRAAFG